MSCSLNDDRDNFMKFLNGFDECTLPFNTESYFSNLSIYSNNSCNISPAYSDHPPYPALSKSEHC